MIKIRLFIFWIAGFFISCPMSDFPPDTLSKLPVFYGLTGKKILLAGDDVALLPKIRLIAMTGAHLHICAPHIKSAIDDLGLSEEQILNLQICDRKWYQDDFSGAVLAIGAFAGRDEATDFQRAAHRTKTPVNLVDCPALCDFQIPVIVNRSPLIIGISTGGAAPVIGQWLRGRLESLLPSRTGAVLQAAASLRGRINTRLKIPAARRAFWKDLAEQDLLPLTRKKTASGIQAAILERLEKAEDHDFARGQVRLIHVPEHPEDMALKTLALLQNADVIVRSVDVHPDYLDFCRRDARRMEPGAKPINLQEIVTLAQAGGFIIWLHGKTTQEQRPATTRYMLAAGITCRL